MFACYEFVCADNTDLSYLHIDGTDAAEEGVWMLTSDATQQVPFIAWRRYEPNGGSGENCLMVNRDDGVGSFVDAPCDTFVAHALCETLI